MAKTVGTKKIAPTGGAPANAPLAKARALPAVIVIAGEELFLRDEHLQEIRHAVFGGEDPGMGLVRLDGGQLLTASGGGMAAILDELRTPSMFAPQKLVVVDPADPLFKKKSAGTGAASGGGAAGAEDAPDDDDDADDSGSSAAANREILERYLETAATTDNATLVLVAASWLKITRLHKIIEKTGGFRPAGEIQPHLVPGWIARRSPVHGKEIEPAAALKLAELVGPDLQRLDNELAKLALYEIAPKISVPAVEALVGFQHEQKIWEMINALAGRDAATALKKIDEIWGIDTKIGYTAAAAVHYWLAQVLKARELADRRLPDAVIGRELKLWPADRAQKVLALARHWGLKGAARWSRAIAEMDLANKSSLGEPRRNMERFVVELSLG